MLRAVEFFSGSGDLTKLCLFVDLYQTIDQLPATQAESERTYRAVYNSTLVTQLGLYSNSAETAKQYTTDVNGMGYVIRLKDGRFIVIDGGCGAADQEGAKAYLESDEYRYTQNKSFEDADRIYRVMKQQTVSASEPEIVAWIFTHADPDHTGAFVKFAQRYYKKVSIGQFVYNFLSNTDPRLIGTGMQDQVESAIRVFYPSAARVTAHAGQVYHIANVQVQMLLTLDAAEPEIQPDFRYGKEDKVSFNDTSLIFRILTDDNNSLMVLGDCYPTEAVLLENLYPADILKSDMVQVSHHGIEGTGHKDTVYAKIEATYALWPAGAWYYAGYPCTMVNPAPAEKDMRKAAHNKWIVENIYLAGSGIQIAELGSDGIAFTTYASLSEYLQ